MSLMRRTGELILNGEAVGVFIRNLLGYLVYLKIVNILVNFFQACTYLQLLRSPSVPFLPLLHLYSFVCSMNLKYAHL